MADEKRSKRSRRTTEKKEEQPTQAPAKQTSDNSADRAAPPVEPAETPGGILEFDPGIITEIAIREASGIEGVAELTGGWRTKGVQVGKSTESGEEGYILDLRIAVEYGVNCVALAETIRNRIAGAIEKMTGRKTAAINIHVTGIRDKGTREEHHEEAAPMGEEHGIDF